MARLFDDASSEYLSGSQSLVTGQPLTIAFWFYVDATGLDQGAVSVFNSGSAANRHNIYIDTVQAVRAQSRDGVSNVSAPSSASASINTWAHAAGVWSADNARAAFLNGGNKGTNSTTVTPTGINSVSVGSFTTGGSFSGRIAELGIWNAALTDEEIAILADGVSPLFVRPQNLKMYFPLIRDEDKSKVGDVSLTAFNTPSVDVHPRIIYPSAPQIMRFAADLPVASAQTIFGDGLFS